MSLASRKPVRMAGAVLNSGNLDTGEVLWNRGGMRTASVYSGSDDYTLSGQLMHVPGGVGSGAGGFIIYSGGGRLNTYIPHAAVSGLVPPVFYDSVGALASGPFLGGNPRRILYQAPANTIELTHFLGAGPVPVVLDVPFQSGLCVFYRSGAIGFTVTFTPEAVRSGFADDVV